MQCERATASAKAFLELHRAPGGFVMPNAWDTGSAVVLASEGFAAIGTTSAGVAFSLGKPDYRVTNRRRAVTRAETLDAVRRIAAAVAVPLNADLESGYGDTPEAVVETVRLAIAAGAAGCNIEDVGGVDGSLIEEDAAVARIAAARAAIAASRSTLVLTARTDVVQFGGDDALRAAVRRGNRLLNAGADCIFVPGVSDVERVRNLVRALDGPLAVVIGLHESAANAYALIEAGAKRVSVGSSIARSALALVRRSARELRERGTVSYAADQIPQAELNALFERAAAGES
ncbi:MAG: isocitrate lyase/phosphoenolpyruvate mutase family protein [Gammaproteobacteria bacterium]